MFLESLQIFCKIPPHARHGFKLFSFAPQFHSEQCLNLPDGTYEVILVRRSGRRSVDRNSDKGETVMVRSEPFDIGLKGILSFCFSLLLILVIILSFLGTKSDIFIPKDIVALTPINVSWNIPSLRKSREALSCTFFVVKKAGGNEQIVCVPLTQVCNSV